MAVDRRYASPLGHYDPADLFDAASTGILLLDGHFCVIYANVAAQEVLGISLNAVRGRPFATLFVDGDGLIATIRRAKAERTVLTERELSLRTATMPREVRILDVTVTPLEGSITGTNLLLELADAAPRLKIARDSEMRSRLDGSRMMVRQLAHEIKNPLGGLRGAAQLLERELTDPALREYTQVIISEADRLTALVDSMSLPARAPQKTRCNVHEVCEHVYHLLRGEARSMVLIERDYDPSLPDAELDKNQLIQALLNIGRNALQAVGERGRIVLRTRVLANGHVGGTRQRLAALLQVEDNGPGIPAELRGSIFYPLVTGRANGTGLGLAVAQDLVTRNGGTIEFTSETGRTVFSIMLPLDAAEERS
ncbi:MAG: nitrogen regulation protein NR(II) [Steroidobacteraceae bacterium]|nr:nitrogen regulation protein NR(II) [Steroidobacteraceae bacterium]MDW8258191.1 nitrogen regulation protein NR(II) [Gammaproteobacteria bacterium]